ncbi:MAG TPA: ECF transporter S component, partial [Clostridiaceae bacterium]|nr:ECF transporter S component [Clostridiaceae bacterium]
LIASMGIPQLITALIGGALAITIAAMLEKRYNKNMD